MKQKDVSSMKSLYAMDPRLLSMPTFTASQATFETRFLNLLFKKKKVTEPNESFSLSGTYSSVV